MRTSFGTYRVLEPKGYTTITAMKLDNNKMLNEGEMRIALKSIHLERENFLQIAKKCNYDEDRVKQRIISIINRRGKLHNSITGTAGVCFGQIEEIYEGCQTNKKIGDEVFTISSLSGIPIMVEEIKKIDMNFGYIECEGYAIVFESTLLYKKNTEAEEIYLLTAIDQSGDLYENCRLCVENSAKNILIIGQNEISTLLYGVSVRDAIGFSSKVTCIIGKNNESLLSEEELQKLFEPIIKNTYTIDMDNPLNAYEKMKTNGVNVKYDYIIVDSDEKGADSLATLLIKDGGIIYLQAINDRYNLAVLAAENMGKKIDVRMFKQADYRNAAFVEHLVAGISYKLKEFSDLYKRKKRELKKTNNANEDDTYINEDKLNGFVYSSIVTKTLLLKVLNIAQFDCNVIIQGETGVGKERILSIIHSNSERSGKTCVKINCATIQENLAESEFFGYEGGAFTGAQSNGKKGYFELADGGTLFLDEIGSLSLNMQSKLLRVLQENQFYRVGGVKQISVDVRVICANNISLRNLVDEGKFREDLYYRLNICQVDIPPLRNRREDILSLTNSFLRTLTEKYSIEKEFSDEALQFLYDYDWPGNVRELENMVHRVVICSQDAVIDGAEVAELLYERLYGEKPLQVDKTFKVAENMDFHEIMEKQEREVILYALKKGGTTRKAAEILNLPQTTLARKKLKHGL